MSTAHLWIVFAPTAVALGCLLAMQPFGTMRAALQRARRRPGEAGRAAVRTEMRAVGRHVLLSLAVPLLVLTAVQVTLMSVVELLGPGGALADLFGEFHPEVALHAADVDQLLADAAEARRLHAENMTVGSALLDMWPLWPAYLVLTIAGVLAFAVKHVPILTRRYVAGVSRRARGSWSRAVVDGRLNQLERLARRGSSET